MSKIIIEIETVRSGQPRAYADSVYEYLVTVKNYWDSTTGLQEGNYKPKEEDIKELVQRFGHSFVKNATCWSGPQLKEFKEIDYRTYKLKIVEAYTD